MSKGIVSCSQSLSWIIRVESISSFSRFGCKLHFSSRVVSHFASCWFTRSRYIHHHYKKQVSEEYPVLKSDSLQHPFKKWEELRKNKLTASTFAGAVGFWPRRRVQLWLEKLGAIEPFKGNLATAWNNINEEKALERYTLLTRNHVDLILEFQVHDRRNTEDSWLGASPDGLYEFPSGGAVVEIKCPYFGGDMSIAAPWKRIPVYHMPQAQGLLEIMDKEWMDFYCWTPNGSSLFRIQRDVEYWDTLREALSDFWWNHVQPAKELLMCNEYAAVTTDSCMRLPSLRPEPRHELCSRIVYHSKLIADTSELLCREIRGVRVG